MRAGILPAMNNELSLIHERVDDIPLIFAMARKMGLPEILDEALGQHGNQQGLSNGWLTTVWLAYMLVEGDHRKSIVEEWAHDRRRLLGMLIGQSVRENELNDDRLGRLLTRLADPDRWAAIESALWEKTSMVFQLECRHVRHDSTTSYGYHTVGEDRLMQLGHSKDHRPDLPQLKLMGAVAEPAGQMLASRVYPGHRADDGLYLPMIEHVREMAGSGLLHIGDAKMASLATRSAIAAMGDQYLTRLPKSSKQEERDQWINRALSDEASLDAIGAGDELFGHGYELAREMTDGSTVWNERVLVYRSEAVAQRQRNGLAQRIESAIAALNALTPPIGRGRRQHATLEQLNAAIRRIERKHKVEGLLWTRWRSEPWPSRALPDRERFVVIDVIVAEAKVEHLSQRLGWQVLVTNVPLDSLPLTEAVPLYNEGWRIEMQFRDIKNRPLGIRPLLVTRDDQIVGLTHLIILALRLMTLITTLVRRSLKASGATLVGLIDGQKSRATDRPTARRLLKAFHRHQITVTRIRGPGQEIDHITPLPPLLSQILQHLGFSDRLYTDLQLLGAN